METEERGEKDPCNVGTREPTDRGDYCHLHGSFGTEHRTETAFGNEA